MYGIKTYLTIKLTGPHCATPAFRLQNKKFAKPLGNNKIKEITQIKSLLISLMAINRSTTL
jgi:hypothetical protein